MRRVFVPFSGWRTWTLVASTDRQTSLVLAIQTRTLVRWTKAVISVFTILVWTIRIEITTSGSAGRTRSVLDTWTRVTTLVPAGWTRAAISVLANRPSLVQVGGMKTKTSGTAGRTSSVLDTWTRVTTLVSAGWTRAAIIALAQWLKYNF